MLVLGHNAAHLLGLTAVNETFCLGNNTLAMKEVEFNVGITVKPLRFLGRIVF